MIPRIDIEDTFDSIISTCGGSLVKDLIGASPPFDNADYIFHEHKIVAELKCLEVDKSRDPATARKLSRLWISWRQRGLVTGRLPLNFDSSRVPSKCRDDIYKVMGEPIRRTIKKANKQIRETKVALGLSDYSGLLLIANDGNFIFSPAGMIHYIQSVLRTDFREIRNFIFFTVNMYSTMRGFPEPGLFWIHFSINDVSPIPQTFSDTLHAEWAKKHEFLTGIPTARTGIPDDMEAFWHAQYKT